MSVGVRKDGGRPKEERASEDIKLQRTVYVPKTLAFRLPGPYQWIRVIESDNDYHSAEGVARARSAVKRIGTRNKLIHKDGKITHRWGAHAERAATRVCGVPWEIVLGKADSGIDMWVDGVSYQVKGSGYSHPGMRLMHAKGESEDAEMWMLCSVDLEAGEVLICGEAPRERLMAQPWEKWQAKGREEEGETKWLTSFQLDPVADSDLLRTSIRTQEVSLKTSAKMSRPNKTREAGPGQTSAATSSALDSWPSDPEELMAYLMERIEIDE